MINSLLPNVMNNEKAVAMAAKLYEARRASRVLLGDRWREHMQFIGEAIKLCERSTGLDTIQAAMKMCERCHAYGGPASDSVHILAAAVEMIEPSSDRCSENDCHYYGKKRPASCACSRG